jgi:transcriptional regulator with GAF, ATPase, and Fis domain
VAVEHHGRVGSADREQLLLDAFVDMADTLVDDFDVLDFLHGLATHCVALLDVEAAGLMLADRDGHLRVAASSTERVRLLELFELQNEEGPCLDCFASGEAVSADDMADPAARRWPRFADQATGSGYRSVVALPLRLRDETIGALNLFRAQPGPLRPADRSLARALADVSTIGILQERGSRRREVLARQLQEALSSRIVIEQAKGVIAERLGLHVDEAFQLLRDHARGHSEQLSEVARRVVAREMDLQPGASGHTSSRGGQDR